MHISSYSYVNLRNINDKYIILLLLWVMYHSNFLLTTKNEKFKDYCKADLKQRVLFFVTVNLKKAGMASQNFVIENKTRCFKSALQ